MLLVSKMEIDPITREVWMDVALPAWAVNKVGLLGVNKLCLEGRCLISATPEAKNDLLFASVHMKCLRTASKTRTPRSLEFYEYNITDGLLANPNPQQPAKPNYSGLYTSIIIDAMSVGITDPSRRPKVIYGVPNLNILLPYTPEECGFGNRPHTVTVRVLESYSRRSVTGEPFKRTEQTKKATVYAPWPSLLIIEVM